MTETPHEYTQRMLDHVEGLDPVAVQAATSDRLSTLIQGVPPTRLREHSEPGKWSVSDILAHLADVEMVIGCRIRTILATPGTPIPLYDQDVWASTGHYEQRDATASMELLRVLREANLALLKSLSADQWENCGLHPERGMESIEQLVRIVAGHDVNHIGQVERILGKSDLGKTKNKI